MRRGPGAGGQAKQGKAIGAGAGKHGATRASAPVPGGAGSAGRRGLGAVPGGEGWRGLGAVPGGEGWRGLGVVPGGGGAGTGGQRRAG
jgi:hypothetical protein